MTLAGNFFLEAVMALYAWLPPPLNALAAGAVALILVVTIIRLIAFLWELLPFT